MVSAEYKKPISGCAGAPRAGRCLANGREVILEVLRVSSSRYSHEVWDAGGPVGSVRLEKIVLLELGEVEGYLFS